MIPSEAEIDEAVYLPQSHWFLWDGRDRFPYLISERAKAETDAKIMLNRTSMVELWLAENGQDRKVKTFSWS